MEFKIYDMCLMCTHENKCDAEIDDIKLAYKLDMEIKQLDRTKVVACRKFQEKR